MARPYVPPTLAELKVLSERALAILQRHFPESIFGEAFLSEGDSYHGLRVTCDCPQARPDDSCHRCSCALPGTPMIGAMSGYYEPEWDEQAAYGVLGDVLRWSEKPAGMPDAEWVEALALVQMTPASHAAHWAAFDRECAEMDWTGDADLIAADADRASRSLPPQSAPDAPDAGARGR